LKICPKTTGMIAELLGCQLKGDSELLINGVATITEAGKDQLTFLANPKYEKFLPDCKAGAIIISKEQTAPDNVVHLISEKPYNDFQKVLSILYEAEEPDIEIGVGLGSIVHETAIIGADVRIGSHVVIGSNVNIGDNCILMHGVNVGARTEIGNDCVIHNNVVIKHDIEIGNRVIIGDGTVIGYDGFGFAPDEGGFSKIPQVGSVQISDDVEIGANCCIDRATIGQTLIGKGSKLDNLVQVAHGVKIGQSTAIAAQTGIAGSTEIGSRCLMGGQVGVNGHIKIGDHIMVGAQSGVTKSFDEPGVISGYPARPHREALRREAFINKIPKLASRISEIERSTRKSDNDED